MKYMHRPALVTLAGLLSLNLAHCSSDTTNDDVAQPQDTGTSQTGGAAAGGNASDMGSMAAGGATDDAMSSGGSGEAMASGGSGGMATTAGGTAGTGGMAAAGGDAAGGAGGMAARDPDDTSMSFFVTSYGIGRDGNSGPDIPGQGNLGGLEGADAHCQKLAEEVGSMFTWRAYLSTSAEDARDRIGEGPWYTANGDLVSMDLEGLHTENDMPGRSGDSSIFGINENGEQYERQQHDVITGSNEDGTLAAGLTCQDWTSNAENDSAMVGHLDGEGGGRDGVNAWNSEHENSGCHEDGISTPGSGLFYCFAL